MHLQLSLFDAPVGVRPSTAPDRRRVTVIAGASRGIGLALAIEFALHGHDLVMISRNRAGLEAAAARLRAAHGIDVWTLSLDVAAPDAGGLLVEFLDRNGLTVDMLVNNAAAWSDGVVASVAPGEAERLVQANIAAVAELTRAVLPLMLDRGRGRILVVGSLAGEVPAPGNAIYSATKAFLRVWTIALRDELRPRGVSVSLLLPGAVATSFTSATADIETAATRALLAATPDAVAWCGYRGAMTGQSVIVPGLLNRILYAGTWLLPRWLLVRLRAWGGGRPIALNRPAAT